MYTHVVQSVLYTARSAYHRHREECVRHVQTALEMAVSRDGASGGIIRLCVVTAKGVERWTVIPGEGERRQEAGGAGGGG